MILLSLARQISLKYWFSKPILVISFLEGDINKIFGIKEKEKMVDMINNKHNMFFFIFNLQKNILVSPKLVE